MPKDFLRDSNPKPLYKVANVCNLPDYVENFEYPTTEQIKQMTKFAFADQYGMLHPIYDKGSTFLSAVYLQETDPESPHLDTVKKAADVWGIRDELDQTLVELASTMSKEASEDNSHNGYALNVIMDEEAGTSMQCYPIANAVQTVKSAKSLNDDIHSGKLMSDWAYAAATRLVKVAKDQGLEENQIPSRVWKLGTIRMVDLDHAVKSAELRKYDGVEDAVVNLYKQAAMAVSQEPEMLGECLKLWADLDTTQGITYDSTFMPEEAFFVGSSEDEVKQASENNVIISTVMVPTQVFTSLPDSKFEAYFRKEASQKIKAAKMTAVSDSGGASGILSTLEENTQKELLQLLLTHA